MINSIRLLLLSALVFTLLYWAELDAKPYYRLHPFGEALTGPLTSIDLDGDGTDEVLFTEDLDHNGTPEIVCRLPDKHIVILNASLEKIAKYELETIANFNIFPLRTGSKTRILVNAGTTATILELQTASVPFHITPPSRFEWIWMVGLLFAVSAWIGYCVFIKKEIVSSMITLTGQSGTADSLLITGRQDRVLYIGKLWLQNLALTPRNIRTIH